MKNFKAHVIIIGCAFLVLINFYACTKNILNDATSHADIFQSFWEIMDERYVFFEEKNIDWDEIHASYYPRFEKTFSDENALVLYQEIVSQLKDGHVVIFSNDSAAFYDSGASKSLNFGKIYTHYELSNFNNLGSFHIGQLPNNITYLRIVSDFHNNNTVDLPYNNYDFSKGFILDLRDFLGGNPLNKNISLPFFNGEKTVCYFDTRNGEGNNGFTNLMELKVNGSGFISDDIPVVVLINENTYSLGNGLAALMKDVTNATLIGTQTGGGGGSVLSVFLPKGWGLRYTFLRHYNVNKELTEEGVAPHIKIRPSTNFWHKKHSTTGEDPQLEKALEVLQGVPITDSIKTIE